MLVLHGFTETDLFWSDLLGSQLQTTCALLPGHGWKPCPADATLASVAHELSAKLPAEGGDLLGYSLGGRIALQLALDHPGRVRRLVLVSCLAGIRDAKERAQRVARDERISQVLEEEGLGSFLALWESNPALKPCLPQPHRMNETIRSMRMNQDPKGLATVLRRLGVGTMDNLWPRLPSLAIPVLLVAGSADARYVTAMREMAGLLPQARLAIVGNSGHAVHREQPLEVRRLLTDFLA